MFENTFGIREFRTNSRLTAPTRGIRGGILHSGSSSEEFFILTYETRSEVGNYIEAVGGSMINIIGFGLERDGLEHGLHSSCTSVRLHTEVAQT